jgi:aquaporin Z
MFNKYLVEFLGTMFLAFIIFATGNYLAIGAALAIIALLGGPISGGSYNPAVTLALYHSGKLMKSDIVPYVIVEILGALAGFEAYKRFVNKS